MWIGHHFEPQTSRLSLKQIRERLWAKHSNQNQLKNHPSFIYRIYSIKNTRTHKHSAITDCNLFRNWNGFQPLISVQFGHFTAVIRKRVDVCFSSVFWTICYPKLKVGNSLVTKAAGESLTCHYHYILVLFQGELDKVTTTFNERRHGWKYRTPSDDPCPQNYTVENWDNTCIFTLTTPADQYKSNIHVQLCWCLWLVRILDKDW